ncbi:MAG TPA: MFS transporter [Tepidisphaeraceae bacterium]|nr:MFS transporter [Tepidisphaeraceae bacterium]
MEQQTTAAGTAAGSDATANTLEYGQEGTIGRYRWVICALLFFATTVNYVDRSVLAVLAPTLKQKIGWTDTNYGDINAAFSAAYAIGLLAAGWFIDKFGTRMGYTVALIFWSFASIAHAFARTAFGFGACRVVLGVAEAGNFPAAIKTVAEWFPKKERSFAIGLFNSGSNIGAILAPVLVPWITITWGWQAAFIITGAAGLIWVAFWLPLYRVPAEHPRLSKSELAYINSDAAEAVTPVPWSKLLPHRQVWAFSLAKALTDPIWWFWLFWAAPYLNKRFGVDIKTIGIPLVIIYNFATVGSIGGGYLSAGLIRAGWSVNAGRKTALLICALLVLPVTVLTKFNNEWVAVLLIGLAAAAHQGFSANLFALTGDLFPRRVVGSITGIGGMFGGVASIFLQFSAGRIVDHFGYLPLLIICGSGYLLAVAVIQLLAPRLEPAEIDGVQPGGSEPIIAH